MGSTIQAMSIFHNTCSISQDSISSFNESDGQIGASVMISWRRAAKLKPSPHNTVAAGACSTCFGGGLRRTGTKLIYFEPSPAPIPAQVSEKHGQKQHGRRSIDRELHAEALRRGLPPQQPNVAVALLCIALPPALLCPASSSWSPVCMPSTHERGRDRPVRRPRCCLSSGIVTGPSAVIQSKVHEAPL